MRREPPKKKDVWDKFQAVSSLVSGVVLAVVAYFLTDSVKMALEERKVEVSTATAMRELLVKLGSPQITQLEAEANAYALASFGRYAIPPLIAELQQGDIRGPAAEKGLRAAALVNKDDVCRQLIATLSNRTRMYAWQTHRSSIGLIGEIDCPEGARALRSYAKLLRIARGSGGLSAYQEVVSDSSPPSLESVDLLSKRLDAALENRRRLP